MWKTDCVKITNITNPQNDENGGLPFLRLYYLNNKEVRNFSKVQLGQG
jgi:hypothetical protein